MQTLMCDIGQGTVDNPTDMPHYPNARYVGKSQTGRE